MKIIFEENSTATQLYPIEQHARVNYKGRQYKKVGESEGQQLSGAKKFMRVLGIISLVVSAIFALGLPFAFQGFYEKMDFWAHEMGSGKEIKQHCVPAGAAVLTPAMALAEHRGVLQESDRLVQENDRLRLEMGDLFRQRQQACQELELAGAKYAAAQQVVQQRNATEQEVYRLNTTKDQLQEEINELEVKKEHLLPIAQEVMDLDEKLTAVKDAIRQSDFKGKYAHLKSLYTPLKTEKNNLQAYLEKVKSTQVIYKCRQCGGVGAACPN